MEIDDDYSNESAMSEPPLNVHVHSHDDPSKARPCDQDTNATGDSASEFVTATIDFLTFNFNALCEYKAPFST